MAENTTSDISPELAAAAAKTVAKTVARKSLEVLGTLTGLLMRSTRHRSLFLSDLDLIVTPAIATGQFMVAEARTENAPVAAPIGAILWALVSDDVEQRLRTSVGQLPRLKPDEWRSGPHAWIICDVGEPAVVAKLLERVLAGPLVGHTIKAFTIDGEGRPVIRAFSAKGPVGNA